jgi:uncharacterized membrane protein
MKSLIILAAVLTGGVASHAETYTCYFTEPFYMVKADTAAKTLFVEEAPSGLRKTVHNVSFATTGAFEITFSSGGENLMSLQLTGKGSDGMSDFVYPFDAKFLSSPGPTGSVGGCQSDTWERLKNEF